MNIYVESNFVLEHALEQEQSESCQRLIDLASVGSVRLIIPAFSLAEPYIALMHKASERAKVSRDLERQLSELRRSKPYRQSFLSFNEILGVLRRRALSEGASLQRALDTLLQTAEVIPLHADMFRRAEEIPVAVRMSMQDSIVLASVVWRLADTRPAESCFLNRNTEDFDGPTIRDILNELGCKLFTRFDHAVQYIEAHLREGETD